MFRKRLGKLLCSLGWHRWGEMKISFISIPSEADCVRILYNREWPAYEWHTCERCSTSKTIRRFYVPS